MTATTAHRRESDLNLGGLGSSAAGAEDEWLLGTDFGDTLNHESRG
jgi:hypothetical protein